jgi:hypothetical protein
MDSIKLIGSFKGSSVITIYRPAGNNIYNSTSKLSSLYDTNITSLLNNEVLYFLSPTYRNKLLTFTTGRTANIFWGDMLGNSTAANSVSQTLTYSNATNSFIQYQRLHSSTTIVLISLNATKLNTNAVYSMLNSLDTANYALRFPFITRNNTVVSTTAMGSYLTSETTGIVIRNECYDRNFEINAFIQINATGFSAGASFKLFITLGTNIIAETQVYCNSITQPLNINLYGAIRTTVDDIGKNFDFKIQYLGSGLTVLSDGQISYAVKTL